METETYLIKDGTIVGSVDFFIPNLFKGMDIYINSGSKNYTFKVVTWNFTVSKSANEKTGLIVTVI